VSQSTKVKRLEEVANCHQKLNIMFGKSFSKIKSLTMYTKIAKL